MPHKIPLTATLVLLSLAATSWSALPNTVTFRNFFRSGSDSLVFNRPMAVKPYPGEDSAFVVLQQSGQILTVRWLAGKWQRTDSAVISGLRGGTSGGDEQGLLGFAFHPGYSQNRKYYLYYVTGSSNANRANHIVERIAGNSGRPATGDAQRTVLRLGDPYDNHNGGTLGFDGEGFLVAGLGDGGDGGDPGNRAQNKQELLGKFIRLDVNGADAFPDDTTRNYAIPATNPFKDSAAYRPEIWAIGVRNPWKWSFHPTTGEIWAGDVGQNAYEEITRVPKGANLGWKIREGAFCYSATDCASDGLTPPAMTIVRSQGNSVTGGVFFAGASTSAYHGAYIFGDYGSHRVWAAKVGDGGKLTDSTVIGSVNKVVSFDRDRQGRILAACLANGNNTPANSGLVLVLESPDMVLGDGPVGVRAGARAKAPRIVLADVRRDPARYEVRGLDGRELRSAVPGAAWVREKGSSAPPQLLTLVW